jgi:hypothetical protein
MYCDWKGTVCKILIKSVPESPLLQLQGGSNMTGTDLCVNKPHQSRSYLNHLVVINLIILFCILKYFFYTIWRVPAKYYSIVCNRVHIGIVNHLLHDLVTHIIFIYIVLYRM